jgi:ring-1,2-phenylacetyl-CoA epoxidase subunit PaaC
VALDAEWPYVAELFDTTHLDASLVANGVAVDPATMRPAFDRRVSQVVGQATLRVPEVVPAPGGGRAGAHTDHLAELLADLQGLARTHQGATW